jgi:DNA-binding ferritin-like protein
MKVIALPQASNGMAQLPAQLHAPHETSDIGHELTYHIAWLRVLSIWFQHAHWATKGSTFYGDHLLFERIYGEIAGEIDGLAEKAVGLTGPDAVDTHTACKLIGEMLASYPSPSRASEATMIAATGLAIVKDYMHTVEETYKGLKESGSLTLGLDDLLMALHNKLEGFVYLLKQRVQSTIAGR